MNDNSAQLMSHVTQEIALSIMPRVQGLIALLDHAADVEQNEEVGAAFNILQDVQRDLQEAHERVLQMSDAESLAAAAFAHGAAGDARPDRV